MAVRHFRYKVTAFVSAQISLDERVLRFQQSMRKAQVPLRNIRRFGVQRRGRAFGAVVLSELLLLTEPSPGKSSLVRLPLDPGSDGGQEALAALREALPGLDTSLLPWAAAAPLLGLPVHSWRDALLEPFSLWGLTLVVGSAAVLAVERGFFPASDAGALRNRALVQLGAVLVGVILLGLGIRRARRPAR
jgi:hypothetical protein